jgi:hypothetical protein
VDYGHIFPIHSVHKALLKCPGFGHRLPKFGGGSLQFLGNMGKLAHAGGEEDSDADWFTIRIARGIAIVGAGHGIPFAANETVGQKIEKSVIIIIHGSRGV